MPGTAETSIGIVRGHARRTACPRVPDPELAWYLPQPLGAPTRGIDAIRPVDPTLVSPFLETLADQGCSVRVAVGSGAVLQTHDTDFYAFSCRDGRLRLSGSTARLVLAHDQLGGAEILTTRRAGQACHGIRLSDDRQRTVAMLCPSEAANADPVLWDTLISALAG